MIFIEFPFIGNLRFPLLIIEWVIFLFSLELAIIFFLRYNRQKHEYKIREELGYFSLFISFALMEIFFIKSDYYSSNILKTPYLIWPQGSERDLFLNFGYISLIIGALIFIFFIERSRKLSKFRYSFSICFLLLLIFFLIIFFIDISITGLISLVFWPVFMILFILYIIDLIKRIKGRKSVFTQIIKYLGAFLLLPIGFFLTTDFVIISFGLIIRLIGSILELISLVLIFLIFIKLPLLYEFEWFDKIDEIFLINKDGACLFYKNFIDSGNIMDKNLISSAITSVKIMVKELTSSQDKGLSRIKKENKIVNIYTSDFLTGVLISKEELKSFDYYLKELVLKIESIYKSILKDWDGDLGIFSPVEDIMNEIFSKH
ncbi:MAG: hypothetical protein ACFE8M_08225 [Candidatus Hermodarchaeota archaeon]